MRTYRQAVGAFPRAFTLVELLVVIGIIGALIAILLPVLSGVQSRGRDIKCQSNLRQIAQAIIGYATENKGSLPYGFYFNRSVNHAHPDPSNIANTWAEAPDNPGSSGDPQNTSPFISWSSLVGRYMFRRATGDNDDTSFPPVLQCPEAAQQWTHIVGYCAHLVAMPSPFDEYRARGNVPGIPAWYKPPTLSGIFPHIALVWDTSVGPGLENNIGYPVSYDLDNQLMLFGARLPQQRFYDSRDVYGSSANPTLRFRGNNQPIFLGANWRNIDPDDPTGAGPGPPYQGNLRFRHNKNTACNVGMADGSVRQFTLKLGPNQTALKHDALRKHFLIKWPSGMPRGEGI